MSNPLDAASIISQAEEMLAIARLSLQSSRASLHVQTSEEELARYVTQQIAMAQQEPLAEAPSIEIDASTRLARQIRRRRVTV